MSKPSDPVIGREIWPVFVYCNKHIDAPLAKAGDEGLTAAEAANLMPHMQHTIELIDRALTEPNTRGYPRKDLARMKSWLITMHANFQEQLR